MERDRDCGASFLGSLAWFDRDGSSWKTSQRLLLGGWASFSETWPRAGMMRSGIAFPLQPSAPLTGATGSSWSRGEYPTPSATEYGSAQNEGEVSHDRPTRGTPSLSTYARRWPTPTAGDAKRSGTRSREHGASETTAANEGTSLTDATCRSGRPLPMICRHGGECRPTLNPRFVEWLMGFPLGWTSAASD